MNLATTPLRRHRWMLVGCLLLFVGYGVFSLRNDDPAGIFGPINGYNYEQGWPWLYMSRNIPDSPPGPGWMGRVNLANGIQQIQGWPLLANLAVAVGLSLAVTCLWWLHCRKGKPWQVSLRELMLLALVFSVAAGGYVRMRDIYQEEFAYLKSLEKQGWSLSSTSENIPWYLQPLRDLNLIASKDWQHHSLSWTSWSGQTNRTLSQQVATGQRLSSFVSTVSITDPKCDDEALDLLGQWIPHCESVSLYRGSNITEDGIRRLGAGMPRLRSLLINMLEAEDELVAAFGEMKNLEDLTLYELGGLASQPSSLAPLRQLKYLKSVEFPEEWEFSSEDNAYFQQVGVRINEDPKRVNYGS